MGYQLNTDYVFCCFQKADARIKFPIVLNEYFIFQKHICWKLLILKLFKVYSTYISRISPMETVDTCSQEKQADEPCQCGDDQQNDNKDVQQPCEDAEQPQQSSKNVEESQKCDEQKVSGNDSGEKCQEAKRASAPSSNDQETSCANEKTQCKEKCLNKKPPSKRPQRCPDHSVDSFHPDMRVQNYLYLENNRLYCHNIFNKAGWV